MGEAAFLLLGFAVVTTLLYFTFRPDQGWWWLVQKQILVGHRAKREDVLKFLARSTIEHQQPDLESMEKTFDSPKGGFDHVLESLRLTGLLEKNSNQLKLTPEGMKYGLRMLRAHRLYELYLAERTGYTDQEWHIKAEQDEHRLSSEEIETLDKQLNYPLYDPHGDPIPSADGMVVVPQNTKKLSELAAHTNGRIVHIEDEPIEIYSQLVALRLYPGMELRVLENSPERITFWADNNEHVLSPMAGGSVEVLPLKIKDQELSEHLNRHNLSQVKTGVPVYIDSLSSRISGTERRRLMDLGFLPGTKVLKEFSSASGNPTAFLVRGSVIALRDSQSSLIYVKHDSDLPKGVTS